LAISKTSTGLSIMDCLPPVSIIGGVFTDECWMRTIDDDAGTANEGVVCRGYRIPTRLGQVAGIPGTGVCMRSMSGTVFRASAADQNFILPKVSGADMRGVNFTFVVGAIGGSTGLLISPNAADGIQCNGSTTVVDKDLINTPATERVGDRVRVVCTGIPGTAAWECENIIGMWAKEL
jgi:hypothetical protein